MTLKYIRTFGFELEGGWNDPPPDAESLIGDGSVTARGSHWTGELPSPVFTALQCQDAFEYLEENYPHVVNSSCGLHVHLGFAEQFRNPIVGCLATTKYRNYLYGSIKRWANKANLDRQDAVLLSGRLQGLNSYCSRPVPSDFLIGKSVSRYHGINLSALNKHGTVEIRVLPAFQESCDAKAAIWTVLWATDRWLRLRMTELDKRPEPIAGIFIDEEPDPLVETLAPVVVETEPTTYEVVQTAPGGNI